MEDYIKKEIESQGEYLKQAQKELEANTKLMVGMKEISAGFQKIAEFLACHIPDIEQRIEKHKERIEELKYNN